MYVGRICLDWVRGVGGTSCMQGTPIKSLRNFYISDKCLILLRSAYTLKFILIYFPNLLVKIDLFYVSIYIRVCFYI